MNSKFRWLLHKTVEENFTDLFTFSVGEEFLEQVVVCRLPVILRRIENGECTVEKAVVWAGRKHGCLGPRQEQTSLQGRSVLRNPRMKTVQQGGPQEHPLRMEARPNAGLPVQNEARKMSRRPDLQLYVPRARRSAPASGSIPTPAEPARASRCPAQGTADPELSRPAAKDRIRREAPSNVTKENRGTDSFSQNKTSVDKNVINLCDDKLCSEGNDSCFITADHKRRVPCVQAESSPLKGSPSVPPHAAFLPCACQPDSSAEDQNANSVSPADAVSQQNRQCSREEEEQHSLSASDCSRQRTPDGSLLKNGPAGQEEEEVDCQVLQGLASCQKPPPSSPTSSSDLGGCGLPVAKKAALDCIPSGMVQSPCTLPEEVKAAVAPKRLVDISGKVTESTEKESWDNMFDENGDCLHPSVLEGLKSAFGKVKIHQPKYDYLVFQPQEPDLSEECYDHVLELYDFPAEFKTQNLMMAFSSFKDRGFDIKWVDDTHALAIFSSPLAAAEALEIQNPFIKSRPVSQAISKSKFLMSKNLDYLVPSRPRPETSALRARRMITGALGMRASVSKEERETERRKLQAAKEIKRQVAKQKQDIWNGTVS